MIGIDTNILLRLWLDDDAAQRKRIDALLAEHGAAPDSVLVTDVVLAEAIWVLKAVYRQDKAAQESAVASLLAEPAFTFEDRESIAAALATFRGARCGSSDCLVVAKQRRLGCTFGATFDRGMRGMNGVRLL